MAVGLRDYIPQMSLAAVAAGADAIMLEVHNDPEHARRAMAIRRCCPEMFCQTDAADCAPSPTRSVDADL